MTSDDVAQYLRLNPGFFTEHAELLENIQVPHPHGGRAIPLSDRQVLALREKNRTLETKLAELIQFGEENDAISEKVHRVACDLRKLAAALSGAGPFAPDAACPARVAGATTMPLHDRPLLGPHWCVARLRCRFQGCSTHAVSVSICRDTFHNVALSGRRMC